MIDPDTPFLGFHFLGLIYQIGRYVETKPKPKTPM